MLFLLGESLNVDPKKVVREDLYKVREQDPVESKNKVSVFIVTIQTNEFGHD